MRYFFFLLWSFSLFSQSVDFDVVVIGSSPFSLLEALYRYHTGNSVLILEQDSICGGAWKSIDVCGVEHVDLGCHQIGNDAALLDFLESYVGCKMVSLDKPLNSYTKGNSLGYYPSVGCYEITRNLLKLIGKTEIVLSTNQRMESVKIDPVAPIATIRVQDKEIRASKIILPYYVDLRIENHPTATFESQKTTKSKFPHLYILVEDPDPPRFSYQSGLGSGIARMMNLTHFVGLTGSGKQLIVFQNSGDSTFETASRYLQILKDKKLVASHAKLLLFDSYTYEQNHLTKSIIDKCPFGSVLFETLNTSHIHNLAQYITKWKMALTPFDQAMRLP